jgi:membrane associated rhomboid family serine protease
LFPLRDINPSESFPKVTLILILVNLGVFILEIMAGPELLNQLVYIFGLVPAYINDPASLISYYPFLTSTFLHGGWMHLIGNMWILWLFGDNIEDHMGSGRFLLFYLICGLLAGMTHYYINPHSTIPVVGASGAVAGVMGAYFWMFRHARILTFVPPFFLFTLPAWIYLGFWALSQLYCWNCAMR